MAAQQYYELYRGSSIGDALIDTIDDLINDGRIEPQLAMKILSNFDRAIAETLAEKVKSRLTFKVGITEQRAALNLLIPAQGHLETYRFCDDVWTFLVKDVRFKSDGGQEFTADKVKIVSCNSKKPGEV
ncbi:Transcription initiation factor IIA subunit 2 [Cladophialophora chaetospira]|uniref:Transcription initiation factor IIA subunit 2 n=1 Tax=Cladophialophora chaetospira TaxID=386627 RepID=A0AA39CMJ1_9EURO|nr:Transcription initiation factor IIA subunit 2 [Cladophialophora chaetospira]